MSEPDTPNPLAGGFSESHSNGMPASAGVLLRQAREGAGLHIGALAVSLKVPVRKLEALEADQIEQLPDAVFARALAASVCRNLKIDAAPILALLPTASSRPLLAQPNGPVGFYQAGGQAAASFGLGGLPKSLVWLAGLLVLGALALAIYPKIDVLESKWIDGKPLEARVAAATNAQATQPDVPKPMAGPTDLHPSAAGSTSIQTSNVAAESAAPALSSAGAAAVVSMPGQSVSAAVGPTPQTGLLVVKAKGETWVEVKDASGLFHLRRNVVAGETVGVSGILPMAVVIGRANNAEIQVRGKSFDLAPVTKDNISRFEVK